MVVRPYEIPFLQIKNALLVPEIGERGIPRAPLGMGHTPRNYR